MDKEITFHGEKFVTLASGNRISENHGFISALDMAWQMGRICRWNGAGEHFWSDLLHSFVVADLVEHDWLKCHALIHDCAECAGNDVPAPFKTDERRRVEHLITVRTWDGLGLYHLNEAQEAIIKRADNRSRNAEAWVVGNDGNRASYPKRDEQAEGVVRKYLLEYPPADTIKRDGQSAREFMKRFHEYWRMAQD